MQIRESLKAFYSATDDQPVKNVGHWLFFPSEKEIGLVLMLRALTYTFSMTVQNLQA